ncbi:MAG TPA: Maf family protein [Anaerovoracaceae bacterium]|nr:Maf family protein [Anaerovoracaceae bacterium]
MKKYILASKSPRRIQLLEDFGISAISMPADIIEDSPIINDYISTVMHLALKKAMYIYKHGDIEGYNIIIGSDTVVYNNEILGKPNSKNEAYSMIKSLSGRFHVVSTGIAVIDIDNDIKYVSHVETKVFVKKISEEDILSYINTEEPYDKAGGYAIQGIFGKFIDKYEGSYTNVMGLPKSNILDIISKIK